MNFPLHISMKEIFKLLEIIKVSIKAINKIKWYLQHPPPLNKETIRIERDF